MPILIPESSMLISSILYRSIDQQLFGGGTVAGNPSNAPSTSEAMETKPRFVDSEMNTGTDKSTVPVPTTTAQERMCNPHLLTV